MQQTVTCETLYALDGGAAGAIINAAIREAVADTDDRGDDGKARKVEIVLTITPRKSGQADISVEAIAKVPKRRTAETVANVRAGKAGAQLQFQDLASDDPDQTTIDRELDRDRD